MSSLSLCSPEKYVFILFHVFYCLPLLKPCPHFYTGVLLTHKLFFLMKITSDRQRQDKMFLFIYAIRKARGCKQFYIKRVTVQTNSWLELCSRKPIPKDAVTTGCHSRTMRMPTVQNLDAHKDALLYKYDVYY